MDGEEQVGSGEETVGGRAKERERRVKQEEGKFDWRDMVAFVELLRVGVDYYNSNPEVAKEINQAIVEGSKYIKDGAKQLFKQLMEGINNAYN